MGWPQWVVIAWLLTGLGMNIADHGKPRTDNGITSLLAVVTLLWLLYMGGFFS